MMELVLEPPVVSVDTREDPPEAVLLAAEEQVVARAVDTRRREFRTVRHCARQALAALGHPTVPLLPGPGGATVWPDGVVGSMTHCVGYRAAAVARAREVVAVGIDAEPDEVLPSGVLDMVTSRSEREHLRRLRADRPDLHWDRLVFSAKESVYKTWFPLARAWLGFEDVEVAFHIPGRSFEARLLVRGPVVDGRQVTGFRGRWAVADGLVVTAIAVPRRSAPG